MCACLWKILLFKLHLNESEKRSDSVPTCSVVLVIYCRLHNLHFRLFFFTIDSFLTCLCQLFEGMKAYRGVDGRIRLFRPNMNMNRMNLSAKRSGLPTFEGEELIQCMKRLVSIDQEWVPHTESSSLYIRPTLIGIDVSFLPHFLLFALFRVRFSIYMNTANARCCGLWFSFTVHNSLSG